MMYLLFIVIGILLLLILFLSAKVYFLRKSANEISEAFRDRLTADTNTLIDISSRDRCMRKLATDINIQLRLLRSQRNLYLSGDRELKDAVTNISHDLRTPLTAICGYLELLKKEEQSDSVRRYLTIITERTEAMKALTEELFRYSVIASTSDSMELVPVNINHVLEESIAANYAALSNAGITPEIIITKEAVHRSLNRAALIRIFNNLITNAVRYSDGDLTIELREDARISFSNTAAELDEIQVGKLFDRFYTVESARQSTGLGLSIAKILTEQMGGEISANYAGNRLSILLTFY